MNKKILILILLLFSGFAFAQTTVNLEDQCNCEVLSGTAVTSPGMTTPAGADTGDVYVNTNTGTIYFWDGDSWELTATDDQQLQNFNFDLGTNMLSLDIESGNTVTVDLSSLNNAGTDDQDATEVNLNAPIDVDGDGNNETTVQDAIADLAAITETVTNLVDNNDGTMTYTNEDGTPQIISKSDLTDNGDGTYTFDNGDGVPITFVGTDDQDATEVNLNAPIDVDGDGNNETTVQDAIADLAAITETVTNLVDNNDGTITYTNEDGTPQTISKSDLTDNADGTYTFDNGDGVPITFVGTDDQDANEVIYDNTTSGLVATDVQAAIDEINAAAGTVALVDNGDGTYDFTDAGGNTTTIADTSISTLVDNGDGTYTYTDETGATQNIDTNAGSNPYDNTTSGLVATDVQAAIDEINAAAGTVALVDNGDGTYDFTDAGGNTTTIADTSISTLVDNGDGTYTYTDETGATQNIDTNAGSNPYDNTTSGLVATDVQAAIDEINAAAGTVALVDNGDGTYDFTDAGGNTTTITDTSISTMADNGDGTYTYTDETGATQNIDTNAGSNPYDNTTSGLVATDVQAAIDEINAAAGTVALVDNGDGTYDFTDAGGNTTTIADTSISTLVDNGDGTYTYTDETGATQNIDTNAGSNPYDNTTSGLVATDVQAAIDEINAAAGTVALVDNGDGTYDFTDAGGNTTTIADTSISTLVDNGDGTYTYTDETGATQNIDTNAGSNPYDNTTSGLVATDVQAAIDEINAAAGTVALVDNGDGTYDFTDAGGNTTTIADTSISTLVDNGDGTYTYTDETGATQNIDTNAGSNPYDNTTSGLVATDVQAAIDEINAAAGTVALVDNGDGTYDFTDAGGNTTTIADTSISTLVDNGDGTYTYTDETGATQNIDTNAGSNPYDNTTSGLVATDVQAAIDEINAAAGTVALVDNGDGTYDFTDAGGNTTTITDTSISTMADNGDGTYTYTDETGATQNIDTNAGSNPYDNTTSGLVATDVQAAIDEINAAAGTVALVDNGDGTYDFTDAGGNTTTIADTSISTLVDNGDGTYTYTDETGATQNIDTNAGSNPYDNTTSGLVATDVQAAIDEINAAAGTVALVDNGDGTYDFTDAGGNTTTIADTSISTLVDNGDATFTYTDESGTPVTITLISGDANNDIIAGSDGGLYLNVAAVSIAETNTTLAFNGATNELTYTNELGNNPVVDLSSLVSDGSETVVTGAGINVVTGSGTTADPYVITATEVDGSVTNEVNTSFAVNAGNLEITDSNGTLSVPLASLGTDDQDIDVLTLNGATNVLTVGIEDGADLTVDLSSLVSDGSETVVTGAGINVVTGSGTTADPYVITATEVDGSVTNEVNTSFAVNAGNLEITDSNGTLSVPLASLGTDDQDIDVLTLNGATNVLTVGIEDGADLTVDLSSLVSDGSETVVTGAGINVVTGSGTTADPYVITATEVDGSVTNEVNTSFAVNAGNLEITDSNGTLSVPLASLGTDDQDIDVLTLNGATNVLTVGIEDGADLTVDLSSLVSDGSETVVTGAGINVVTGSGTTADPYVITATEVDGSVTNEVNTSFAVNAGNLEITDSNGTLSVPLASLGTDDQDIDVLTLNGATNVLTVGIEDGADLTVDLSSLVSDGSETVVTGAGINVVTGSGTTADPYVITATEVDGSVTNEHNTAVAMNAGSLEVTDGGGTLSDSLISTDANNDIAAGSDGALYLNVASVTISETITNMTDAGNGLVTYVNENGATQTVAKADITDNGDGTYTFTNNDGSDVILNTNANTNPYDNSTSGLTATNVQDAIDELNTGSSDDQTIATNGTAGNISIEDGNAISINVDDADASVTNEVNTSFAVNAGNLEITDSNGTLSVPLASLGTDDQDIDVLTLNGATNVLTVGIEDGADLTVDLSSLVSDGSETVVTGAGINVVTGSGTTADPYVITATEVDGSVTNEVNTSFAVNAGNLEITDSNGTLSVPLASLGTDDQDIDVLTLNGATNVLTVGIEDGADLTVDLSSLVSDGSETVVTGAGINVVTGSGTTADPYVITATEVDGSVTNEVNTSFAVNAGNLEITDSNGTLSVPLASLGTDDQDIDVLTLNGATNVLTVGIEDGADLTVDLSSLVSDGSETVVTGAGINVVTGSGTTADPYVITATEVDGSVTNEVNTSFAVNAGNLEITDSNGTLSVPLASLGTDDQDIDVLTLNGATNVLTVGIEDGADLTVDLSSLVSDGSETVVTGAGINVVTGSGTTADPYVITATEVDGSVTNEVNTSFAVNAGNLEITDSNGTLSVPLASLGTDDQDIDVLTLNGATNVLTVGIEDGADLTVDLSSLVSDGSETVVTGAGINVVTGSGTTADPYVITATEVDGSVTNEVNTSFAVNAGNLEITDSNGTLSVPLASLGTDDQDIDVLTLNGATNVLTVGIEDGADLTVDLSSLVSDGSETVVTGAGINVVTGSGTTADPYVITATEVDGSVTNEVNTSFAVNAGNLEITDSNGTLSVPLASLGTDDQDIDVLTLNGATNVLTVGIEDGADLTVDLSSLVSDGSETVVTGAGINVVTGSGTTADPYVITATEVDGSVTNEVNTSFAVNAGNLEITDSNGTLSVPLASLGTDDQDIDVLTLNGATNVLTVGIEDGADLTVDLSSLVSDGSETVVTGAGINVVTGSGTTADPYVITATEVDGSVTNEVNTSFAVNAGNLEITDSNGTLSVPLASLGTDDQDIDVLTLNGATNVLTVGIEDGADLTVDLSSLVSDGSETVVTGAGINVVTGSGTTADPYVITATEVDGSVTNEVNTSFAVNAGNLEITDSNGTLSVPLASLGTDDQDIDVLTLNGATNVLTVGIEDGADLTVDLSSLVSDGSETVVTGAGINVVTGSGTTADPYVITATEVDGSVTNEVNTSFAVNAGNLEITDSNGTLSVPLASLGTDDQDIDVLTLNGATNVLTVGIEDGADLTVDLSSLVSDGSETVVTGAGINVVTGSGTTADPYVITATEVDGSVTNEVNTSFAVNAGNLEITDSNGTLSVPLASLGTDDQDIDVLTLNGATNVLTVGIEDGADLTVDLSSLVSDGSETVVTGAGINVVTGSGTTADPYVITATEVDGSVTNEVNTSFAVNAGNLEITDSNGTLSVPLASLGTDDQDIDVLTLNGATNVLTVGIEDGADLTVDLSSLADDDVSVTNTIAGNRIATISEPGVAAVDIDETVTSLSQNTTTGVISYTDEDGGVAETANVVGAEADNIISVGANGGAYLSMPMIYSTGKINGNGTAASIYGATVSRINEGDYQVTFTTALANANYIIQLVTIDCNGDCPGNTSANYDDPGITYYDQQTSGFKVNIGDSDNGTNAKDDIDLEFMYTVIKLP